MAKTKITHTCQNCGAHYPKWAGQCLGCGAWNSLVEEITQIESSRRQGFSGTEPMMTPMQEVTLQAEAARLGSGLKELDRVLGGGLVIGSAVLIGEIQELGSPRFYYKP